MKNKKLFGIIAVAALVLVSMVFVSCGPSISGTFSYRDSESYTLTFKGKNFEGTLGGSEVKGTFTVKDDVMTLTIAGRDPIIWTVVDKETLKDDDGDTWNKKK